MVSRLTRWARRYKPPSLKFLADRVQEYYRASNWYRQSYHTIKTYLEDPELFIKLLAATSQRNSVKANTAAALDAYRCIQTNTPITKKYGIADKLIKENISRIKQGAPLKGPKIKSFAAALNGDSDKIVIDVWMLRAFNIKRQAPTPLDRYCIQERITQLSNKLNMAPRDVQACLWTWAKTELNNTSFKESYDFSYYLKQHMECVKND